jgi:hypothetical protein
MSVKAAEWWRTDSTEFDTELYAFDRECLVKIKNIVMVYNALRVLSGKAVLHPVCRPFVDKELESVESRRVLLKSLLHVALMQAF